MCNSRPRYSPDPSPYAVQVQLDRMHPVPRIVLFVRPLGYELQTEVERCLRICYSGVCSYDLSTRSRGSVAGGAQMRLAHLVGRLAHLENRQGEEMIAKAPFGRTGHLSTRAIFGAAALSQVSEEEADRTLETLLEYGVNHIDSAASYGDAEVHVGRWMTSYRDHFFLATKTAERTYEKVRVELHRSLDRLRVDQIDLIQMHNLVSPEQWGVAMAPGGALEALIEARDQKLVRFIGVTGHDNTVPAMHYRSLERFDFDSVLLPYNYMQMADPHYADDFVRLATLCRERRVAVQTIKAIARRPWGDRTPTYVTWYEPLEEQEAIDRAVHWVLGCQELFLNTVGDITLLPKVLDAAARFEGAPPDKIVQREVTRMEMRPLFNQG